MKLVIIFILFSTFVLIAARSLKVYNISASIPINSDEKIIGLKYLKKSNQEVLDFGQGISACVRFNYRKLNSYVFYFGQAKQNVLQFDIEWRMHDAFIFQQGNLIYVEENKSIFHFPWFSSFGNENSVMSVNKWNHLCISIGPKMSNVTLVLNGVLQFSKNPKIKTVNIFSDLLDDIYLGRISGANELNYIQSHLKKNSHPQLITDYNLWNFSLTVSEMIAWTGCSQIVYGNIIDWRTAQWDASYMTTYESNHTEVCSRISGHVTELLVLKQLMNITSGDIFCHALKGKLNVITDSKNQDQVVSLMKAANCRQALNGWSDEDSEGNWKSIGISPRYLSQQSFQPWSSSEPNGEDKENCGIIDSEKNSWDDVTCSRSFCIVCDLPIHLSFVVRGLCLDSLLDTHYSWARKSSDNLVRGYTKSVLEWTKEGWKITPYNNPYTFAVFNESSNPTGTKPWYVVNDTCSKDVESMDAYFYTSKMLLSLTMCGPNDFNCNDGTCINLDLACDGAVDCSDGSDEIGCHHIAFQESYKRNVPRLKNGKLKLNVNVSIDCIFEINNQRSSMMIEMILNISWTDQNLQFINLNDDWSLNGLSVEQKKSLWMPKFKFHNTRDPDLNVYMATFDDEYSTGYIKLQKNAKSKLSSLSELQNYRTHKGTDALIVVSKSFTPEVVCEFNFELFPFDNQECYIEISNDGTDGDFVELVENALQFTGPVNINQYQFESPRFVQTSKNFLKILVKFKRVPNNKILTTLLPTVLINLVCIAANLYADNIFDVIVMVNLTGLLVMATIFNDETIPITGSIKMIDVWKIISLAFPFAEIILHSIIHVLNQKYNITNNQDMVVHIDSEIESPKLGYQKLMKFVKNIATYGLPFSYTIFLIGYISYPNIAMNFSFLPSTT